MSNGAKSKLYGGCFSTSNFRARSVSTVCAAVWGLALWWSNNTLIEGIPRHFDHIAGFNSFTSMSLYRALVTVWPFSWKCTSMGLLTSQTMVSMTFPAQACVLNFLLARNDRCFHCIDCLLLSGSKCYTQESSPGTVRWRKACTSRAWQSKFCWQIVCNARLWSSDNCLGTHLLHTFLHPSSSWTILCAEPFLMLNCTAISSVVTRLLSRIRFSICCCTVSVVTLTGLPCRCASVFVFRFEIFPPIHTLSPDSNICVHT